MKSDIQEQIKAIIDTWEIFDLSDVNGMTELRRTLSVYHYNLSYYKGMCEKGFLTCETQRKNQFNTNKLKYIEQGKSAAEATVRAEVDVQEDRIKEVKNEREYKRSKDVLQSVDHVLNAISGAIRLAEKEYLQGKNHI